MSARSGLTLLELLVTLAILGVGLLVAAPALMRSGTAGKLEPGSRHLLDARRASIHSGRVVRFADTLPSGAIARGVAYPTGIVFTDGIVGVDPLTGRHSPRGSGEVSPRAR